MFEVITEKIEYCRQWITGYTDIAGQFLISKLKTEHIIVLFAMIVFQFIFFCIWQLYDDAKDSIATRIEYANKQFTIQKKKWNFNKTVEKYRKWGVLDRKPKMASPTHYLIVHTLYALFGGFFFAFGFYLMKWSPIFGIIGLPLGWLLPDLLYQRKDKADNLEMTSDIMTIYNVLSSQMKGGAYIGDALTECRNIVSNNRLKNGLTEIYQKLSIDGTTLTEAVVQFEQKFNNINITTLCMIIKQAEENGKTNDVLRDISRQMSDLEEIQLTAKRDAMDRTMTLVMVVLFASVLGYVMYFFVKAMLQDASGLEMIFK